MAVSPPLCTGNAHKSSTSMGARLGERAQPVSANTAVSCQLRCPVLGQHVSVWAPLSRRSDGAGSRDCGSSVPSGLVGGRLGESLPSGRHWPLIEASFSINISSSGSAHSLELRPTASGRGGWSGVEKFKCVELRKSEFVFILNWSNSCLTNVLHPLRVLRSHLADAADTEIGITTISSNMQDIRCRCACCSTHFEPDG